MARQRPVSRQHIQAIVNDLQRAGLVELIENPRHKRSRLVVLTRLGNAELDEIISREQAVLSAIEIPVTPAELAQTEDVLVRIRTVLESPLWRQTVRRVLYKDGATPDNPWLDDSEDLGEQMSNSLRRN
jgi:DNA-binding PadR family transcriptional regulator